VARVELADPALADPDRLILTHNLPNATTVRLRKSLRSLPLLARIGPELPGR
jgi:hypothetical protein